MYDEQLPASTASGDNQLAVGPQSRPLLLSASGQPDPHCEPLCMTSAVARCLTPYAHQVVLSDAQVAISSPRFPRLSGGLIQAASRPRCIS